MGQLGQGEDALPGEALDLLLAHTSQQTEVVLPDCLLVAPSAELAHLTVLVEQQPRRLASPHLLKIP
jgi:hypothetical protein